MKSRSFNPLALDVAAFAEQSAEMAGQWPVAELERLLSSVLPESAEGGNAVDWKAAGSLHKSEGSERRPSVSIEGKVRLSMECQRCLKPVEVALQVDRRFLFVQGENEAAQLDELSEDDVLALTRSLDLRELIEDELLLGLPLVPRHTVCPQPLQVPVDELEEEEAPHPFAALAALKKGGLPN